MAHSVTQDLICIFWIFLCDFNFGSGMFFIYYQSCRKQMSCKIQFQFSIYYIAKMQECPNIFANMSSWAIHFTQKRLFKWYSLVNSQTYWKKRRVKYEITRKNIKKWKKIKNETKTQKREKHPSSIGAQVLNSYLFQSFGRFERNSVIHNRKCYTQLCISIYVWLSLENNP